MGGKKLSKIFSIVVVSIFSFYFVCLINTQTVFSQSESGEELSDYYKQSSQAAGLLPSETGISEASVGLAPSSTIPTTPTTTLAPSTTTTTSTTPTLTTSTTSSTTLGTLSPVAVLTTPPTTPTLMTSITPTTTVTTQTVPVVVLAPAAGTSSGTFTLAPSGLVGTNSGAGTILGSIHPTTLGAMKEAVNP